MSSNDRIPSTSLAEQPPLQHSNTLVLSELSADVRDALSIFDRNRDGSINLAELVHDADIYRNALAQHGLYKVGLAVAAIFFILILLSQLALGYAALFLAKDFRVTYNPSNISGLPVLTDTTGSMAVQTATLLMPMTVSSVLPNDAFSRLRQLNISSSTSAGIVTLSSLGWARVYGSGTFGSTVQVLTHAGTISLDGQSVKIRDVLAPLFTSAGFVVGEASDDGQQELLGTNIRVSGLFNYLATLDVDKLEEAARSATKV